MAVWPSTATTNIVLTGAANISSDIPGSISDLIVDTGASVEFITAVTVDDLTVNGDYSTSAGSPTGVRASDQDGVESNHKSTSRLCPLSFFLAKGGKNLVFDVDPLS